MKKEVLKQMAGWIEKSNTVPIMGCVAFTKGKMIGTDFKGNGMVIDIGCEVEGAVDFKEIYKVLLKYPEAVISQTT